MNIPMKRKFIRPAGLGLVALAASAALALSGCAGGSEASESGKTQITVGVPTSVFSVPVRYGIEAGLFEEAGLDVEVVDIKSTSDGAALLANGEIQFSQADVHNTILARSQGTDLAISAPMTVTATEPPADGIGFGNLLVLEDSGLTSPKQLEGKKIGTNTIGGTAYLDFVQQLKSEGVDIDKVEWIQVPGPQLISALRQGQIDATTVAEPNGTIALQAGGVKVLDNADAAMKGAPNFGYASSRKWLQENADTAEKFQEVVLEANKAINADRVKAEEIIAGYMDLDEDVVKNVRLPHFAEEVFTPASVQPVADRLVEFDVLAKGKMPSLDEVIWTD